MGSRDDLNKLEEIVDIIIEIHCLLEESRLLSNTNSDNSIWRATVMKGLLYLYHKLESWRDTVRKQLTDLPYRAVPSRLHNPSDDSYADRLFPFALEWDSLNTAALYNLS
ncbi:uncharacterized protein BDR25DRAFT_306293 [Lindgomyces ingoldianus]|uniref:Uncharacterized protein n=1 Tax=Lindgomyces ingoldianus TaxID=673940 RepID=A0ACB6QGP5_9PLEO|nr:uncharacterized protein BDR25DRAFT_306293 [Lindgomyces ingoldianus]KAF2466089.1 hypothetical protein BDR25DRAFT_306293 [Lindgomyces ingoldianus]